MVAMHLLKELSLPDRYERLVTRLGTEVANLLTAPSSENISALQSLASDIYSRDEGILVPLVGTTGIGKTTFAMHVSQWVPSEFGPTCLYEGDLTFEGLVQAVKDFSEGLPANNKKIIPINIDHRENSPPNDAELATLKRFLRTNAAGVPALIFWPETSNEVATRLADRYVAIAGPAAIPLPLVCKGPEKSGWVEIAKHTLSIANRINHLEELGIDPENYKPEEFHSLGTFLRKISQDFNRRILDLRAELEKPVSMLIVYASESADPGVLTQLTSPSHYGLLDSHALISVTAQSEIGKWWSHRRGLLTRTIVQLNAHALCLAPTAAASSIRNFSEAMPLFDEVGYRRYGPGRGVRDLSRSDFGKMICEFSISRHESRGTPGEEAATAFQLLSEQGFNLGRDKSLNKIMKTAVEKTLEAANINFIEVTSETKLPYCPLIPDNAIHYEDRVLCIEYTWRKGKFLDSGNRSTVAQYALSKLQSYARQLGWTVD